MLFNVLVMNMSYTKPIKKTESKWAHNNTNKTTSVFLSEKFVLQENVFLVISPFLLLAANSAHEKLIFITLRVYTSANCICCDFYFLNLYYALLGLFRIKIRVKIKFYVNRPIEYYYNVHPILNIILRYWVYVWSHIHKNQYLVRCT